MYRFIARHDRYRPDFSGMFEELEKQNSAEVEIIRPMLFFHEGQKEITMGKLREFFTDNAINRFKLDGFIMINILKK